MSERMSPLLKGTILQDRYTINGVIGDGGFSIVYLASDAKLRDACAIKELAPEGSFRDESGLVHFGTSSESAAARLRAQFISEAKVIGKLPAQGILTPREAFVSNGTAYLVLPYVPTSETLETRIHRELLSESEATELLVRLLITLSGIHRNGVLHRDIKPNNILIDSKGRPYLIDFGAAREWQAERDKTHTVMFTPGYAAPEQLAERARRGPQTDLYGLCATIYHAVTGERPPASTDRLISDTLVSAAARIRDPRLAKAIDFGLRLPFAERPIDAEALLRILDGESEAEQADEALESFDQRALMLNRFRFDRRECPSCNGVLEKVRPLKKGQCAVCRQGTIRKRKIEAHACPHCQLGRLIPFDNSNSLSICPMCAEGQLLIRKRSLFRKERVAECGNCDTTFEIETDVWCLVKHGGEPVENRSLTPDDWRAESGRSHKIQICSDCHAQFDLQPDGRLKLVVPAHSHRWSELYPDEWARVAAGLLPNAGNADCDSCGADYYVDDSGITLLAANHDPFGFAQRHTGRLLSDDQMMWLAVGKESPSPGFVCADCQTEFDESGEELVLVQCSNSFLASRVGQSLGLESWHRIAKNLPLSHEVTQFQADFMQSVREAYHAGALGFAERGNPNLLWKGSASKLEWDGSEWKPAGGSSGISIDDEKITFGGLLKKGEMPLAQIQSVESTGNLLTLKEDDGSMVGFQIEPMELTVNLQSGNRTILLTAADLKERIQARLAL